MSLRDYRLALEIASDKPTFPALIMAAYRAADDIQKIQLRRSFPTIIAELDERDLAKARPGSGGELSLGEHQAAWESDIR